MTLFLNDLRYAVRVLWKTPGFTLVALFTLALAIGSNTAIFSIINGLLLRPLPYPQAQELVQVQRGFSKGESPSVNIPEFLYVRDHNGVFSGLATYDTIGSGFNLVGDGAPERITGSRVSQQFFPVFGVRAQAGRGFLPEEDRPGGPKVVVLSDGLWRRRFGGDRSLVGKTLNLNGESYTVVGVMAPGFRFPATAELWTPVGIDPASMEKANYLEITARLKDGVSLDKAEAEMKVVAQQFGKSHPGFVNDKETIRLKTLQERLYGQLRPALLVLLGAVGCVLLIACVNVGNLQLARAAARRREVAIRAALGARTSRIFAQLITESVLLALAGGVLGLFLGWATLKPLLALSPLGQAAGPAAQALLPHIGIDGSVLAFTFGVSLLAGVLFGLVPALQATRVNLYEPLKEGTTKTTGGRKMRFARYLLVVSEVALALMLITSAALLLKSFAGLTNREPGFRPDHVLSLKISLPEARYGKPAALDLFSRQVAEQVRVLPGVRSAAVATSLPLELGPDMVFAIEGKWGGGDSKEGLVDAQYRASTGGYFETLRIPLARGRYLNDRDTANTELVAVINEAAARLWNGEDPLGARIRVGAPVAELADPQPRRIVGIVKDVHETGLDEIAPPVVYVPIGQIPPPLTTLFVRMLPASVIVQTAGAPTALTAAVRQGIWAVDPQQPISDVVTMEEIVTRSVGSARFTMVLMGALALLALILAAVGIYGVLSYLVNQRTREIGVRMALGATSGRVMQMVVGQGMVSVGIGVAAGIGGAFLFTKLLRSLLVGVSAHDPLTFILAPVVLATVALVASSIPARRASLLDPVLALRRE